MFVLSSVPADKTPKNEAERLKVLKTLIAHSQFCSSGGHLEPDEAVVREAPRVRPLPLQDLLRRRSNGRG